MCVSVWRSRVDGRIDRGWIAGIERSPGGAPVLLAQQHRLEATAREALEEREGEVEPAGWWWGGARVEHGRQLQRIAHREQSLAAEACNGKERGGLGEL